MHPTPAAITLGNTLLARIVVVLSLSLHYMHITAARDGQTGRLKGL